MMSITNTFLMITDSEIILLWRNSSLYSSKYEFAKSVIFLFLLLLAQYTKLVTSAHEHGAMIVGAGWKLDICHFQQGVVWIETLVLGMIGHIYRTLKE